MPEKKRLDPDPVNKFDPIPEHWITVVDDGPTEVTELDDEERSPEDVGVPEVET